MVLVLLFKIKKKSDIDEIDDSNFSKLELTKIIKEKNENQVKIYFKIKLILY